ncbi:putative ribonuclease H-like domain-containing protein [Tanacetum coccineum]|uniref:Ribonuclease H-like domain-containing protein n=1 Tax=Tanacetum coccineum TaxID=301880 RepID=A0ABQ5ED96_9ASTR
MMGIDFVKFPVSMMYLRESSFQNIRPRKFLRSGSPSIVGYEKSGQNSKYESDKGQITRKDCSQRKESEKARTTLLMALPEDHLAKFHKMTDAKEMWDAIKSRFGGNDESKKMQKYILKQQFEGFSVSNTEGLHKGYDRFQQFLRSLEIHGAGVSTEDANQKFLRSLPSAWSQVSLIMRTKPGVDSLSFDDLYNNLRVFESDIKGSTASSSSPQNVAFVSENTSSTNEAILLESVESRELKITGGGMHGILETRIAQNGQRSSDSDTEREQLSDASIEIMAYSQVLKKVEAHIVVINKDNFEAQKEKEDLKAKVEKWHNSSKNLSKLLNTQMSANDKFGLGYGDHRYDGILSYENEVLQSVFMNKGSELENQPLYDRFVTAEGMHVVPPPMIGNYMPSGPDVEIDDSKFTYGPKQTQPSESESQSSEFDTCESNISAEPSELVSEPVVNESNVKSQPKVWSDAPIIEEYESDSDDESALTRTGKIPVNTARTSSTKNVSTARLSFNRQTILTSTTMKVNTVKPIMNRVRPANVFHKTHSPTSRPFKKTTILSTHNSNQKFNTAKDYPHRALKNKGIVDSGCSRHMTGNKAYLAEFQDFNGGPVAFGGSKGYITGKGKIKTGKLDFEDVCFVKELQHFNLFSVSQMCDKKNKVLFTDSECLVLSPEFKLPDENQVLLKIPRQNNMYSFNLENIVPSGGLACLIAKATTDESNKWHRRLGHVNFKNLNKLVKGNLVRGLPSKIFQNDHTCVACQKGKQHKASCKAKSVSSISHSLQLLHMDLFGPTSVRSLNHKTYCLVITDDFSRFSWVFFLRTKDETSGILKDFIRQIENQLNQKVKTIRCDNGTEFKNKDVIEFCGSKGIKREYSNARTPQQNGVAERKNRTLIEAARTMLADSFLPNTFWAEAVSTACYVLNRVLVTKPHNKTPYELLTGKIPIISYIRPFGCHVTILNTIDHLGKFAGKSDEGFLVGYSLQSKAFRVYNLETKRVEENLHITFLENKPNVAGKGPTWLFDLDYLTDSMNYHPVRSENQANLDHMETENAQDVGRTREIVDEDKEIDENILSTEDGLSTDKEKVSTDKEKVSTDRPIVSTDGSKVSTDRQKDSTAEQIEGTDEQRKGTDDHTEEGSVTQTTQPPPTSTIFGDDETIAKVLLNMSQAKAVSRVEERRKIEEEDETKSESHGIPKAEKKFKQLASDEEMARKIQEEWEGKEERNRLAEEKATNEALIRNYDDIKARIEADRLLAEKLQEEEREQFTIEERAKFLHDTIAAQRKFLAQQRSEAIRNRPPTKNQLRNQMMTYLKHVGNFKHSDLKTKKFLYEKIKRSDEDFISIGSAEDERLIKKMNEKGIDSSKNEMVKEEDKEEERIDSSKNEMVKEEDKEEESTRKRKLGTRKKIKSRKRRFRQNTSEDDSEKENDELRLCLTIAPDEEKEVDYENSAGSILSKNGKLSVLELNHRDDLNAVYQLVMDRYQDEIPEGFDRVLWGDLMIMFNPDDEDKFWNSQQDWNIVSWKLHGSSGVHTLMTEAGLVIHMLVEKKYPLRKKVLLQMLELKLESEEDSTMALELIRFVKKQIAELEPEDSDGDEKDL